MVRYIYIHDPSALVDATDMPTTTRKKINKKKKKISTLGRLGRDQAGQSTL
jgi:hypothetical protein